MNFYKKCKCRKTNPGCQIKQLRCALYTTYNIHDAFCSHCVLYSVYCLVQGCPTRGPRAACSPLGKPVRPFLILSSFTPFFKGKKFILGRNILSKYGNLVGGRKIWEEGQAFGRYSGGNEVSQKKGIEVKYREFVMGNFAALLRMEKKYWPSDAVVLATSGLVFSIGMHYTLRIVGKLHNVYYVFFTVRYLA